MITIIAAVAENGIIGNNNKLPWHLPEDLKRFKELTTGKVVVMGRKTYESIVTMLGKPLPNRKNIVITHQTNYKTPEEVSVFYDLSSALDANKSNDVFVIGGGEIYVQAIPLANRMYITHIHKEYPGDRKFPKVDMTKWKLTSEEPHEGYTFAVYERK